MEQHVPRSLPENAGHRWVDLLTKREKLSRGPKKPKLDLTTWDDKMLYALIVVLEVLSAKRPTDNITEMLTAIKAETERRAAAR